jgi:hypothetical protein
MTKTRNFFRNLFFVIIKFYLNPFLSVLKITGKNTLISNYKNLVF